MPVQVGERFEAVTLAARGRGDAAFGWHSLHDVSPAASRQQSLRAPGVNLHHPQLGRIGAGLRSLKNAIKQVLPIGREFGLEGITFQ